jgi:regulator of protease activity HflC (stomatin/prohibitin superfamily)
MMKGKSLVLFIGMMIVGLIISWGVSMSYDMAKVTASPEITTNAALDQMRNTDEGAMKARATFKAVSYASSTTGQTIGVAVFIGWMAIIVTIFMKRKKVIVHAATALAMMFILTGCNKKKAPYDKPEYVEVNPSETAFMIPLEGDASKQVKLDSETSYDSFKVMAKRVQIPKRWDQTGPKSYEGSWIPVVRVIRVDRSPVTREWDPGSANKNANAIWTESSDSVGFSCGITCTAYIKENEAAKFLYWYPNGSLAAVMDSELRARIQQNMAEFCAKFPMDTLREQKVQMMQMIREDVNKFFEPRGVTVTTIGMFGGFTYENKQIQDSIDAVFVAQQEKAKEKALLEAMDSKKKRMTDEGMAEANRTRSVAQGEADSVIMRKKAEAEGIELVTKALDSAKANPLFIQLKSLEVESERIKKWNGDVPQMMMGNGQSIIPMIQMPDVSSK